MFRLGVLVWPVPRLKKTCRYKLNFAPAWLKWSAAAKLVQQIEKQGREEESGLLVLDHLLLTLLGQT